MSEYLALHAAVAQHPGGDHEYLMWIEDDMNPIPSQSPSWGNGFGYALLLSPLILAAAVAFTLAHHIARWALRR